jgi:sphinganine-1-phosphate aldolase
MMSIGRKGYVERTRKVIATARYIQNRLSEIPGLLTFPPDVSVISIRSDELNIYSILDGLQKEGWALNPLQFPPA